MKTEEFEAAAARIRELFGEAKSSAGEGEAVSIDENSFADDDGTHRFCSATIHTPDATRALAAHAWVGALLVEIGCAAAHFYAWPTLGLFAVGIQVTEEAQPAGDQPGTNEPKEVIR